MDSDKLAKPQRCCSRTGTTHPAQLVSNAGAAGLYSRAQMLNNNSPRWPSTKPHGASSPACRPAPQKHQHGLTLSHAKSHDRASAWVRTAVAVPTVRLARAELLLPLAS